MIISLVLFGCSCYIVGVIHGSIHYKKIDKWVLKLANRLNEIMKILRFTK